MGIQSQRLLSVCDADVDVLALMNSSGDLISPDPLPSYLLDTAKEVARDLGLAPD